MIEKFRKIQNIALGNYTCNNIFTAKNLWNMEELDTV